MNGNVLSASSLQPSQAPRATPVDGVMLRAQLPALFCAAAIALCLLIAHPSAEISMNDEWSYVFSAQHLASTGHVAYNGWAAPMQGWLMLLGALVIKVLGFSFAGPRLVVLGISMATAYLLERSLERLGINPWNATVGTLAVFLSPLFLELSFVFMTDIPGLFCLVLCLFCCLRAVEAPSDRTAFSWLIAAAVGNMVGGTVRQTAWLGVLVLVPSTAWLMRRRRGAALLGGALWMIGLVVIGFCMSWLLRQPYSVREPILGGSRIPGVLPVFLSMVVRGWLAICLYLSPVLVGFAVRFPFRDRRATGWLAGSFAALSLVVLAKYVRGHHLDFILAPFVGNCVTSRGLLDGFEMEGTHPLILSNGIRLVITLLVIFVSLCFVIMVLRRRAEQRTPEASERLSWRSVLILLLPLMITYLTLLVPRALRGVLFDRYLVPIIALGLPLSLRFFQERFGGRLPAVSLALVVLMASFSTAGMHDLFVFYRARLEAIDAMRAVGVPRTSLEGGWDYDGWTQLEAEGYVNEPLMTNPPGAYKPPRADALAGVCAHSFYLYMPAIQPLYALSYDPAACLGLSRFAPVHFRTWFAPHDLTVYTVKMR